MCARHDPDPPAEAPMLDEDDAPVAPSSLDELANGGRLGAWRAARTSSDDLDE